MLKSRSLLNSLLCLTALSLFSCSQPNNDKYKSYAEFSSNLNMVPTENCDGNCTALKSEFKYLVYVAEQIYCYWDEKQAEYKIDFKKTAEDLENQITSSTTDTQYFLILNKWAAAFKDGHVNAMLREDRSDLEFYSAPVRFEMLAPGTDHEKLIVSAVGNGVQNLKVGTVVEKIQGKDWKTYIDAAEKYASGSTIQMRHRNVGNYIPRALLEQEGPKSIAVEGSYKGKRVSENISRNISLYDGTSSGGGGGEETGINLLKSAILENNIGYLRIDGFSGTQMRRLMGQAMDRLADTDGLILDVRTNGGGDLSGDAILSRLTDKVIVRFQQKGLYSDFLNALRPSNLFDYNFVSGERLSQVKNRRVAPADAASRYTKPVVVLTSSYCFSACDTFVSALKENGLAVVVGESTGGGTGNPQGISLPISGHSFRYSVAQGFTAVSHTLLEGVGTSPNVVIEPSVEERVSGTDTQLQKTLQYLSTHLKNAGANIAKPEMAELPAELKASKILGSVEAAFELERDKEIRKSSD